jgi:hypothetical protein
MPTALKVLALLLGAGAFAACTTDAQRRATENTEIKSQAAQEIDRICSLPPAEREAALEKLKEESGLELQCAKQQDQARTSKKQTSNGRPGNDAQSPFMRSN